jgi:hypothetical protein
MRKAKNLADNIGLFVRVELPPSKFILLKRVAKNARNPAPGYNRLRYACASALAVYVAFKFGERPADISYQLALRGAFVVAFNKNKRDISC